ncbi:MAG: hypothetical protein LBR95_08055 [Azoarcus sp.]|jgi:hypothetical protein|nr:hypothetical protein [Azoarcus sp.]
MGESATFAIIEQKMKKPLTTETQRHRDFTEKTKEKFFVFLSFAFSLCLKETLIKSKFVIPAKAGIQENQ